MKFNLYGLLVGLAVWLGSEMMTFVARKEGVPEQTLNRFILRALVLGVIGARLYHVIDWWWYYREHIPEIVMIWHGGLGIWGGILGGMAAVLLSSKQYRLLILDVGALAMPIGQAVGRWGNFANQELYGLPTTLPWGIPIAEEKRLAGFESFTHFHPLFLYESLLMLLAAFILWYVYTKKIIHMGTGSLWALYLITYSLVRFSLEPLRINPWKIGEFPVAQLMAGVMMGVSIWYMYRRQYEK